MQRKKDNSGEVILGLFLLVLGLSGVGGSLIAGAMLLVGFLLLARQFQNNAASSRMPPRSSRNFDFPDEERDVNDWRRNTPVSTQQPVRREAPSSSRPPQRQSPPRQAPPPEQDVPRRRSDGAYMHAVAAARAAGINPDDTPVMPVDIGMMAFKANAEPMIQRTHEIDATVDYIQPFVQLLVPVVAKGRVRFEIFEADGTPVFIHEDVHQLNPGLNLVTPTARLPIQDQLDTSGSWRLRVSADGVLIADHRFGWEEDPAVIVRRAVEADGEITNELHDLMQQSRLDRLSLDELLADQEDDGAAGVRGDTRGQENQRRQSR